MRHWKIHLGWAVVTAIAVGVTARIAFRSPATEPSPRPAARIAPTQELTSLAPSPAAALPGDAVENPEKTSPSRSAADEVRKLLDQERSWWEGFKKLKELDDPALKLSLYKHYAVHGHYGLRVTALRELAALQGREAAGFLLDVLQNEKLIDLRAVAADELGRMGAAEATPSLLAAMQVPSNILRIEAANALLKLGMPTHVREMLDGCVKSYASPDGGVRRQAVEDASQLETSESRLLLIQALRDSNGDVRLAALYAVANRLPDEAAVLLAPLAGDPNADVATSARDTLENLRRAPKGR